MEQAPVHVEARFRPGAALILEILVARQPAHREPALEKKNNLAQPMNGF